MGVSCTSFNYLNLFPKDSFQFCVHNSDSITGIAPCGLITFMSEAFGGRVTDGHLTARSGILDLLEYGDVVLADKGFPTIERSVLENHSFLVMPPLVREKRQFSAGQNEEGYQISSLRIHVERAIERIKRFRVLKFIERPMLRHLDMILIVLSYVVNNLDPLIKKGENASQENEDDINNDSINEGIDLDESCLDGCNCTIDPLDLEEMIRSNE